jgi:hypothetical protein
MLERRRPTVTTYLVMAAATLPLYLLTVVLLYIISTGKAEHEQLIRDQIELRQTITTAERACRTAKVLP